MIKNAAFNAFISDTLDEMNLQLLKKLTERKPTLAELPNLKLPGTHNVFGWRVEELKVVDLVSNTVGTFLKVTRVMLGRVNADGTCVIYDNDELGITRRGKPRRIKLFNKSGTFAKVGFQTISRYHVLDGHPKLPGITLDEERALKQFPCFTKAYRLK